MAKKKQETLSGSYLKGVLKMAVSIIGAIVTLFTAYEFGYDRGMIDQELRMKDDISKIINDYQIQIISYERRISILEINENKLQIKVDENNK